MFYSFNIVLRTLAKNCKENIVAVAFGQFFIKGFILGTLCQGCKAMNYLYSASVFLCVFCVFYVDFIDYVYCTAASAY